MPRPVMPSSSRARYTAILVLTVLLLVQACSGIEETVGPAEPFTARGQASVKGLDPAEALPFKGRLEGVHVSRTPLQPPMVADVFELTGQATQLGQFELVIESVVNFGVRPVTGAGTLTFTAANGDRLVANQTGSSRLVAPGLVMITEHAIIDPNRSTGRFAGATGTFTVEREADAATGVTGLTSGSFQGTITLRDHSHH